MMDHQIFVESLPGEIQEKINMLSPEAREKTIEGLMKKNEYAMGGKVPVRAERNETLTVKSQETPKVQGGYLKKLSENPASGETTYEIPDNKYNLRHEEGHVSMQLEPGSVINSDKQKIPTEFRIGNKDFMNKSFKEASDYLSKLEKEKHEEYKEHKEDGQCDKVSEGAFTLMMSKYSLIR